VHLSTAFCHCDLEELEERTYETPVDPHDVMRCVQWMDETSLNLITERYALMRSNPVSCTQQLRKCTEQDLP
jgi:fatty acyl-CoA reductase